MSETRRQGKQVAMAIAATGAFLSLAHGGPAVAGALDGAGAAGAVRFHPAGAPPPILASRVQGVASAIQVAEAPAGTLYAATDQAGKARVWLLRGEVLVADVIAPSSRPNMNVDWSESFAFWLGALPVAGISWKFAPGVSGIEDIGFWVLEGGGRSLGALPGSTQSACAPGGSPSGKECGRCGAVQGIPIDLKLVSVEPNRARFVQQLAGTWFYYFSAAPEIFEQDFLLTANGLAPDGQPRRMRYTMPLSQAKESVKPLLREYFRLAKTRSRPEIAPEFLTCFEQLVELSPDFGQGHYNVGCMHALLGNQTQAVASVTKAISLDPKYRKVARRDPDLATVRDDPGLASVLEGGGR